MNVSKFKLGMYRDTLCLHGEIGVFVLIMRALTWQRVICLFIRYLVELLLLAVVVCKRSLIPKAWLWHCFGKTQSNSINNVYPPSWPFLLAVGEIRQPFSSLIATAHQLSFS
jgi:hypothetical protein